MAMWYCFKEVEGPDRPGAYQHGDLVTVLLDPKHSPSKYHPSQNSGWKAFTWVKGSNVTAEELNDLKGDHATKKSITKLDDSFMSAAQKADAKDHGKESIWATSKGKPSTFTKAN